MAEVSIEAKSDQVQSIAPSFDVPQAGAQGSTHDEQETIGFGRNGDEIIKLGICFKDFSMENGNLQDSHC
jgi:hypothetical protein